MNVRVDAGLIALLLLTGAAAQEPAAKPAAGPERALKSLRPKGPVTVTADRAEWEKGGAMLYAGNVSMVSDTLTMKGDRLELRQKDAGQYEALLTGNPARLDHAGDPKAPPAEAPPVSAEARSLYYDSVSDMVKLDGAAHLTRGTDEIAGDSIRYDVAARRIKAEGGEKGQVRIVIQPPAREKDRGKAPAERPSSP